MPASKPTKKIKRVVKSATKKNKTGDKRLSRSADVTAKQFIERLKALQSPESLKKFNVISNQTKVNTVKEMFSWASEWEACSNFLRNL